MDFAGFMIISIIENTAWLILMLRLFRFEFCAYYNKRVLFIATMLSCVSALVRSVLLVDLNTPVLVIVLFLFLWLMFEIRILHALIMVATGAMLFGTVQLSIILFMHHSFKLPLHEMITTQSLTIAPFSYALSLMSTISILLILWLIRRYDCGFDFISDDRSVAHRMNNRISFLFAILMTLTMTGSMYFIFQSKNGIGLITTLFLVTILYLFFLNRQEVEYEMERRIKQFKRKDERGDNS